MLPERKKRLVQMQSLSTTFENRIAAIPVGAFGDEATYNRAVSVKASRKSPDIGFNTGRETATNWYKPIKW